MKFKYIDKHIDMYDMDLSAIIQLRTTSHHGKRWQIWNICVTVKEKSITLFF